ncbi:MAG: FAD-dependent oxidoreductase, partial [Gemmatimonadota bacterium]
MIHGRPDRAPEGPWDVIVVGGGAYGAFTALEAARMGLRPLLLERGDFGGETSRNSLRIVHGGLRYLQSLDLARYRRSVAERRWLLETFPDLVRPLRCVLPLYGRGLRRRPVLRAALALDHVLSPGRNRGVADDRRIPRGRVVDAGRARDLAPE